MSSPVKEEYYDALQSPIFATASKRRQGIIALSLPTYPLDFGKYNKRSPLRSPIKRGILGVNSPLSLPSGRAGLTSPQKRSIGDLDRFAKNRAIHTKYARLMEDDDGYRTSDNEYLNEQDLKLADEIIGDRAYGSDVELEEDFTEEAPKRTRGRKTKAVEDVKKLQTKNTRQKQNGRRTSRYHSDDDEDDEKDAFDFDSGSSSDDAGLIIDSDDDGEYLKPSGSPTRAKAKTRERDSPTKDKKNQLQLNKSTTLTPSKSNLSKNKRSLSPTVSSSPTPRKKVGRPSKATELVGKIKSIFHVDDEELFSDSKSPERTNSVDKKEEVGDDDAEDDDDFSLFSQTLGSISTDANSSAKIISGINSKHSSNNEETLQINRKTFEPMPIPKVSADGTIQDDEFVAKYLKNMQKSNAYRLTDDGSIFLEGTEGYFEQHAVRSKATGNSLSQFAPPLEYSEFIPYVKLGLMIQYEERQTLKKMYSLLYHQWCFELSQGFNLNFNGTGSKRTLVLDFIGNYFIDWYEACYLQQAPKILIINGYNPAVKLKQIVGDVLSVFVSKESSKKDGVKFPKHVLETVPFLVSYIDSKRKKLQQQQAKILPKIVIVIHSIDGPGLRDEKTQSLLSLLCSIPEIWLISSSDNINVSLLWDLHKLKNFNFIFHDLTTYEPFSTEVSFKDILSMGRSTKNSGIKGAKYVLSSLTKNAKSLFKVLLVKQLANMKDQHSGSQATRNILKGTIKHGLEFKIFYQACFEEFITSNEISFRTLLGEFMEHKMCSLVKDDSGTEVVFIPFSYSEMEALQGEC